MNFTRVLKMFNTLLANVSKKKLLSGQIDIGELNEVSLFLEQKANCEKKLDKK